MKTKLTRSQTDKILGGVCAGLGDYLNIDPVFVRLFFIVLTVIDGIGFWIYILLWLLMPASAADESHFEMNQFGERARQMGSEFSEAVSKPNPDVKKYLGAGLILMGLFFFFEKIIQQFDLGWFSWFNQDILQAVLLLAAGIVLLVRAVKER